MKRMPRRVRVALITAATVAGGAFALPSLSSAALYAYYGDNYSYNPQATRGTVCDMETDGDGAYINYVRAGSGQYNNVQDANGSQPGCSSTTYGQGIARITAFKTCEDQVGGDPCGATRYP